MKKIEEYYVNQHSSFLLQFQLILITKNRNPILQNEELKENLLEYTNKYFKDRDIEIMKTETGKNYFHIYFNTGPHNEIAKMVNAFKSASSRVFRKAYPDYLKAFNEKAFWSMCYFVGGIDDKSKELANKYIEDENIM